MKERTSPTRVGGAESIVKKIHDELNGKITKKEIRRIISLFWGQKLGLISYLFGTKSFSINHLFFFSVYKNKAAIKKEINDRNVRKAVKKNNERLRKIKKDKERERIANLNIKEIYENLRNKL